MLEKNTRLQTLVKLSDAKAKIEIWRSETEKMFGGYIYQLYDNSDFDDMYISYLRFDVISGITVIVTDKWGK